MQESRSVLAELPSEFGMPCYRLLRPGGKAVVLLHEIFGITPYMRRLATFYAVLGYSVYVPALFHRQASGLALDYQRDAALAQDLLARLDLAQLTAELLDFVAGLRQRHGRLAVVGFCLGGRLAYRLSCREVADCAVAFYGGRIHEDLPQWGVNRCPLQLHYGQDDAMIRPQQVEQVLAFLGGKAVGYIYPDSGHGFCCSERSTFHQATSMEAAANTLLFLNRHL
ncbi:dienelactone hydrolase family protein [Vogesella facilis]|uniref:Dienelactone hydrolase family protein n=1 Tax=Vogesella facilis TaxID=1655232 RepID=A0ABV7RJ01_9NEIS